MDVEFIKIPNDPMAYLVKYENNIIGHVAGIGRFGDWAWSFKTEKVDRTSTFGVFSSKESAASKLISEYNFKLKDL